jgi:hypothetical protein
MGKKIPFTWYVVFGAVATFLVGYLCSILLPAFFDQRGVRPRPIE